MTLRISIPLGKACAMFLASAALSVIVGFLINFLIRVTSGTHYQSHAQAVQALAIVTIFSTLASFLATSLLYGFLIREPQSNESIGPIRGTLVTLVDFLIRAVIGLIIFVIYLSSLYASGNHLSTYNF